MDSPQPAGFTVWLTGLPDSGKSTLGALLREDLARRGYGTVLLDATEAQERLAPEWARTMDRSPRVATARRFSYVARLLNECGGVAIIPYLVPWRADREDAWSEIPRLAEVFVDCPPEICARRDEKGRWAEHRRQGIRFVAGEDFEPPLAASIRVRTDQQTTDESLAGILKGLRDLGYLRP